MAEIIDQTIQFDEQGQYLISKYDDGVISSESISAEDAVKWHAEYGKF